MKLKVMFLLLQSIVFVEINKKRVEVNDFILRFYDHDLITRSGQKQ